jgi:hypothetical protein
MHSVTTEFTISISVLKGYLMTQSGNREMSARAAGVASLDDPSDHPFLLTPREAEIGHTDLDVLTVHIENVYRCLKQ